MLEPVSQAVTERYERFRNRMDYIQNNYGSLRTYASDDQLFGFNYDPVRKGWWYREWAPSAAQLYLMGDFNDWNNSSHPLVNNGRGIWEIFLDDKTYKTKLKHEGF